MNNQYIIEKVLEKIESELDSIEMDGVIAYSGFSYYHFHRLFQAYVGETIYKYMKRLKLERSAHEIKYKNISITDAALNAGFGTPSAFNKAFREFFGCSPTDYKKSKPECKEFDMIEPIRVEEIESIRVYSVRHVGDYNGVGAVFEKLMKWAYTAKIRDKKNLMNKEAFAYGIYYDDPNVTDVENLRSDVCISNTDDTVKLDEWIVKKEISGGKYAVFIHKGEYSKLNETYNVIFSSFIKREDLALRDVPVFEKYLNRDPRKTKPENLRTEIYVPIK